VETNASNASVRKRPKVDKIPTTSKRKKFDSTGIDNSSRLYILFLRAIALNFIL
jgi:hypothetical protein